MQLDPKNSRAQDSAPAGTWWALFRERLDRNKWLIVGLIALVGFVLGVVGFWGHLEYSNKPLFPARKASDAVFYTLQMFILNYGDIGDNLYLHAARFLLPLSASLAALIGIYRLAHRGGGGLRVRFTWADHVVVIGGGALGRRLALEHHNRKNKKYKVVLVHLPGAHEKELSKLDAAGIVLLEEDATQHGALMRVAIHKARVVYIVTSDDETNFQIFRQITTHLTQAPKVIDDPLVCMVHHTSHLLAQMEIESHLKSLDPRKHNPLECKLKSGAEDKPECKAKHGGRPVEVRPFNSWAVAAQKLIQEHGPDTLCDQAINKNKPLKVVVVGANQLAEQLVIQGALLGQYAYDRKLNLTLLGDGSTELRTKIVTAHPVLMSEQEIEKLDQQGFWWSGVIHDEEPNEKIVEREVDERTLLPVVNLRALSWENLVSQTNTHELFANTVVYVCADNLKEAVLLGHRVFAMGQQNKNLKKGLREFGGMKIMLCAPGAAQTELPKEYKNVFDRFDPVIDILKLEGDEKFLLQYIENSALHLHLSFSGFKPEESTGERWWGTTTNKKRATQDIAREWARESNRQAVAHLSIKQRAAKLMNDGRGFDLSTMTRGNAPLLAAVFSRMEHQRWCAERFMYGWRLADIRDSDRKHHPLLRTFDLLSEVQKNKDANITQACAAMASNDQSDHVATYLKKLIPVEVEFAVAAGEMNTLEGIVPYSIGDALMTGQKGERWPIQRADFERTYYPASWLISWLMPRKKGKFIKKPMQVKAVQVTRETSVLMADQRTQLIAKPGDWVVTAPDESQWVVEQSIFKETYLPL